MPKNYKDTYILLTQFTNKTFRSAEIGAYITANDLSSEETFKCMYALNIGITPSNALEFYLYSINLELRIKNGRIPQGIE